MLMSLTPEQLVRLSLVRYLLQQAETQAAQPAPLCALAILPAHDALEMFLDVAAEALNAPPAKSPALRDYWDRFKLATPPIDLPMQRAVEKLNRSRIALKHHGQRGSEDQIREHLVNARTFLDDACERCFSLPLSLISMANLVQNANVKADILSAEAALEGKDFSKALTNIASAFAKGSVHLHRKLHLPIWGIDFQLESLLTRDAPVPSSIQRRFEQIERALERISNEHGISIGFPSLGIDLRDFERFRALTPVAHYLPGREPILEWMTKPTEDYNEARWCVDFVIDFMLKAEVSGKQTAWAEPRLTIEDIPL